MRGARHPGPPPPAALAAPAGGVPAQDVAAQPQPRRRARRPATGREGARAAAAFWGDIWRRRGEWQGGYADATPAVHTVCTEPMSLNRNDKGSAT